MSTQTATKTSPETSKTFKTSSPPAMPTQTTPPSMSEVASKTFPNLPPYQPPTTGWVSKLPASWVPYVQLARLSPPAGLFLIFFPHLFGAVHAALLLGSEPSQLLRINAILFAGSFFLSNAIHIWNDLIDAPLDAQVERTCQRPVPRGAVSVRAALIFIATQTIPGVAVFGLLDNGWQCFLWSLPSMALWTFYPYAKRVTFFPQVELGLVLAWGVLMGQVAMGFDPLLSLAENPRAAGSAWCLFLASTLWTVVYDTIYAHQDVEDDIKAGIKSMAVMYHGRAKPLFWKLIVAMASSLIGAGYLAGLGGVYYTISAAFTVTIMGLMVERVTLDNEDSCWWWFKVEFWFVGSAITGGLLGEFVMANMGSALPIV